MLILVTLVFGLLGAFLARLNKELAVRVAAFVLGGFILQFLLVDAGLTALRTTSDLFAIVIGGITGIVLELVYRSSAMIVISSFCGAALVTLSIEASDAFEAALFSGLAAVGMLLQSREWIDTGGAPGEFGSTETEKALADL
jgi:hypothetical protein